MAWLKKKRSSVTAAPETETAYSGGLRYQAVNLQGVGSRARQEDSFTLMNALDEQQYQKYGLMFAVCDGMGEMKDGKLASETAISSFRNFFSGMDRSGSIAQQLRQSVFAASTAVEQLLEGDGGSTVVIGVIYQEQLYFASVGDSCFYLKRGDRLIRLNTEHNVCHQRYLEFLRSGNFDPLECRADPEAAALSQFLGMPGLSEVDGSVRPLGLQKGDILVACSDGVGGVLLQNELSHALDHPFGSEVCRQIEQCIIDHANPDQDNYTALIVKCI